MADDEGPKTYLQGLQLEHADEGQLQDIQNSHALSSDIKSLGRLYFMSPQLIGCAASISLATTASYWGFSPPAAILTYINEDIGPTPNSALFSIVWTTCAAISIIVFGRTSDKFGRRYFLISASIMGFIGGIIACTAKTMNVLIGANVLLGLAGGVHTCYGLMMGEIMPNKYKLLGLVFIAVPSVIATGFGPYLSLSLYYNASWRWCYYIYLIIMGPAIILQFFLYRPPGFRDLHGSSRTLMDEVKRVDFVGIFILVAGLALFLLGISWGGQPQPWSSPMILGLIITGGLLLIIFVLWEMFAGVPNPLVPMYYFRDLRGFVCLNIISAVAGTLYVSLSILWPSQVAYLYTSDSTNWQQNGWLATTIQFGVWGGIMVFGSVFHIIKHSRLQCVILLATSTAFLGALSSVNSSNRASAAAFSFLAALPAGVLELIPGILIQLEADDVDLGTVFAIIFCMRTAWGSIFTAVFVAILNNKTPVEIAKRVPEAAISAGLPESSLTALSEALAAATTSALAAVPGMTTAIEAAVSQAMSDSYAAAYSYVYYAAVAVGATGLIAAICMKDYDSLFTDHVARKVGNQAQYKNHDSSLRNTESASADEKTSPNALV